MWPFKKRVKVDENILKNINKKFRVRRYFQLLVGVLLIAVAFNMFLLPNNIVCGGVTGISIITSAAFQWSPSIVILVCDIVLLIISYFALGKKVTAGSVLGSILLPIFIELTAMLPNYFSIDTSQVLLMALFGGVLYGLGAGLIFKAGFTTGGTDIINQIISKYGHVSMGTAMLCSDGLIVVAGVFSFGITKLLYAMIVLYIISLISDKVLLGISNSKAFYIIAEKDEEIKEYIMTTLNHGVTIFDARGGFTKERQKVLMCVVPTSEYFRLKEGIHMIDHDAFFVVADAYEVFGGE